MTTELFDYFKDLLSDFNCPKCGNKVCYVLEDPDKNILACRRCILYWNLD